jgi:ribonuclease HII
MLTIGIDEVGRGPWAGPLAVCAVLLDSAHIPDGLKDSKQTTKKFRETEIREIQKSAISIGLGWISAPVLDQVGMTHALHLATMTAFSQILEQISANDFRKISQIVIDGTGNFLENFRENLLKNSPADFAKFQKKFGADFIEDFREKILVMPKADAKVSAVSAASIIAKVYRDRYMAQISRIFPAYDFAKNSGYGVKNHRAALEKFGVISGVHRASFKPIREILGEKIESRGSWQTSRKLAETSGRKAEIEAANFLVRNGHEIISQNYKTRFYEIDIISRKAETLYFTEVKFRENRNHGDGLDAITPKKLAQMKKAAEIFLASFREITDDFDIKISAIALTGNPPEVEKYIENV